MKKLILVLIACLSAQAAVTIDAISTTATEALVQFTAPTSPACTVQVSEASGLSPLDYDTDPSIFTNANTEASHSVNSWASLTGGNTVRVLRIGLRKASLALDGFWHSRALAANALHYVAVTCNGVTANSTFTTSVPAGIVPEAQPLDSAAWGQVAFPQWTDYSKAIIEPRTGMKMYTVDPSGWSWDQSVPVPSGFYSGGSGWTNPANITSATGGSVATTGNTNPINVFFNPLTYNDGVATNWMPSYFPYNNFNDYGLDIYGSGTDASAANRTVQVGLSLDSGQTIYSTVTVQLALPVTTNAAAGTVPCLAGSPAACVSGTTAYPAAYWKGWGKPLPRNAWPTYGYVTVASGVVTLVGDGGNNPIGNDLGSEKSYFHADWPVGTKIYIAGSSASCTNNLCTLASVQNSYQLTIAETGLTLGTHSIYQSVPVTFVISKTTATGTINISVQYRVAGSLPQNLWTGGCSPVPVTSSDSITGFACLMPSVRQAPGALYFIGTSTPVIRLISPFANNPAACTNSPTYDCPNGTSSILGPTTAEFDPVDPTKMYIGLPTGAGKKGLFLAQYNGTWLPYNHPYASTGTIPTNTSEITYTNLTPLSTSQDIRSQILAAPGNTYVEDAIWGNLDSGALLADGMTGPYAIFSITPSNAQNAPCFVFAFTAATGTYFKQWRTDNGTSIPALHFTGCHAVSMIDGSTAANGPGIILADSAYKNFGGGGAFSGPFQGVMTHVYRSGVASSNTALPWPPDSTYDNTCPGGLPAFATANGATGNQCVKVDIQQPCSTSAGATEISLYPCPRATSTQSSLGSFLLGDYLRDQSNPAQYDGEGFMVVQIVSATTSSATLWLQRNANRSYCTIGNDAGANGAPENTHITGWTYTAMSSGSCTANQFLVDIVGNLAYPFNQNLMRGHGDATSTGAAQQISILGAGALNGLGQGIYNFQFERAWANVSQPTDYAVIGSPSFARYQTGGYDQSYATTKQVAATAELQRYAFDFRHYDGGVGNDPETPGMNIGVATNCTLQGSTSFVYKCTISGTPDVKHQSIYAWAGHIALIDISSAATGNQITDAKPWTQCYAYNAGECRSGSSSGDYFISGTFDVPTQYPPSSGLGGYCWSSQMNLKSVCLFAGPVEGAQAVQMRISGNDPDAAYQRWLGQLLMTPSAQYVYSKVLPTPDAKYILFCGFLTSGYHTGLMMAQLPPYLQDSIPRNTYVPITVSGTSGTAIKIKLWYDEFGPGNYCTTRAEACYVAAATVNEATPFKYASESITTASGTWSIQIPALPGHIVYWQVIDGSTVIRTGQAAVN